MEPCLFNIEIEDHIKSCNSHCIEISDRNLFLGRQNSNRSFNATEWNYCSMIFYENTLCSDDRQL